MKEWPDTICRTGFRKQPPRKPPTITGCIYNVVGHTHHRRLEIQKGFSKPDSLLFPRAGFDAVGGMSFSFTAIIYVSYTETPQSNFT